jgi:hypothetical protein
MAGFDNYTVAELKEACRRKGYIVSGTRDALIYRLRNGGNDKIVRGPVYEKRTVKDLDRVLERNGMTKTGTKADKIEKLRRYRPY